MGKFRAPTLRNIAVTAPYMHDGSIATLEGVIDHYAAGGRTISAGEYKGVGSASPQKSAFVKGFKLTAREKRDLIAFLRSLTDEKFLRDPRFGNPWSQMRPAAKPGWRAFASGEGANDNPKDWLTPSRTTLRAFFLMGLFTLDGEGIAASRGALGQTPNAPALFTRRTKAKSTP
jgi:hypothetical protein